MRLKRLILLMLILLSALVILVIVEYPVLMDYFRFNHIIFLRNQGKYEQAIGEYQHYFVEKVLSIKQLDSLVDLFVLDRDFSTALDFSLEICRRDAKNPECRFKIALLSHLSGNFSAAYENFKQCRELLETTPEHLADDDRLLAETYIAWYEEEWSRVITLLSESTAPEKQELQKRAWTRKVYQDYTLALQYTLLGAGYYNLQQFIEAQQSLQKALSSYYGEPLAHFFLGLTYCSLDDFQQGNYHLSISRVLLPDIIRFSQKIISPTVLFSENGTALSRDIKPMLCLNDYEQTDYLLDIITTNSANAGEYYLLKGDIQAHLDRYPRAIESYRRSLVYSPDNISAAYRLAELDPALNYNDMITSISTNIVELETLPHRGDYGTHSDFISMARSKEQITFTCDDLGTTQTRSRYLYLGLIGRSQLRNGIGAMVGIYLNNALIKYLYFPSPEWDMNTFTIPCRHPGDEVSIVYINNYVPFVDDMALEEDRNVYLDRILVLDRTFSYSD